MMNAAELRGALGRGLRSASALPGTLLSRLETKGKSLLFRGPNGWCWIVLEQARQAAEACRCVQEYIALPSGRPASSLERIRRSARMHETMCVDILGGASRPEGPVAHRGDWIGLSRSLGEMIRLAGEIVRRMTLFEVPPDEAFREAARLHRLGCVELALALRRFKSRPREASGRVLRARRAFAQARHRVKWLRAREVERGNAVSAIKTQDIDRHFLEAADRGAQAADLLGDILVKGS